MVVACGPPPAQCTAGEEPYCDDPACVPLCADGALRRVCDDDGCRWVDGTADGPADVLCFTWEDAPNEITCARDDHAPVCACAP